jgi:hypothetical protein
LDSKIQKPVLLQTGFILGFFKVQFIFEAPFPEGKGESGVYLTEAIS